MASESELELELEQDEARARFLDLYDRLKDELLQDPVFHLMDDARRYVDQMLDYNIRGGKLNRGFSVIQTYQLLKHRHGQHMTDDEFFLAAVLGWSIEWLQACLLVLDDIMDNSTTRRGQLCWYKLPKVGSRAINDGVFIKGSIYKMVKRYFRDKPYYVDLLELSDEVALQTSFGQMLDLVTSHESERDISKYNMPVYRRIVQYKTSYYSFYLPIACALLLHGEKLENFADVKNILVEMGIFFQVQDDFLDCFGDPEVTGKIGTDIEDHKCTWLIIQALEHANDDQLKILYDNYGKADPECIKQVKNTYKELDLEVCTILGTGIRTCDMCDTDTQSVHIDSCISGKMATYFLHHKYVTFMLFIGIVLLLVECPGFVTYFLSKPIAHAYLLTFTHQVSLVFTFCDLYKVVLQKTINMPIHFLTIFFPFLIFLFYFVPIKNAYFEYELSSYANLLSSIEALPNPAVQEVLKSFLRKIYRRRR